ncbi:hypothetical protein ACOSQ3_005179 [Xanthoceras sorbifolium]
MEEATSLGHRTDEGGIIPSFQIKASQTPLVWRMLSTIGRKPRTSSTAIGKSIVPTPSVRLRRCHAFSIFVIKENHGLLPS